MEPRQGGIQPVILLLLMGTSCGQPVDTAPIGPIPSYFIVIYLQCCLNLNWCRISTINSKIPTNSIFWYITPVSTNGTDDATTSCSLPVFEEHWPLDNGWCFVSKMSKQVWWSLEMHLPQSLWTPPFATKNARWSRFAFRGELCKKYCLASVGIYFNHTC